MGAAGADEARGSEAGDATVLQAYLTEYEQCVESYRHTYQTIWQVGSFFAVISAGLFALSEGQDSIGWALVLAPVPLLMWYVGVFSPMDRYGQVRKNRLVKIEENLDAQWNVRFYHFRSLDRTVERTGSSSSSSPSDSEREDREQLAEPDALPRWLAWPRAPRVTVAVGVFARALFLVWLVLIALFVEEQLTDEEPPAETRRAVRASEWLGPPLRTRLRAPLTTYRFYGHREGESTREGRWVTPVLPPAREDVAKALLAPPTQNPMDCWTVVTIPRGQEVELGWVGPNGGNTGGGLQVNILPPRDDVRYSRGSAAPWGPSAATAAACAAAESRRGRRSWRSSRRTFALQRASIETCCA